MVVPQSIKAISERPNDNADETYELIYSMARPGDTISVHPERLRYEAEWHLKYVHQYDLETITSPGQALVMTVPGRRTGRLWLLRPRRSALPGQFSDLARCHATRQTHGRLIECFYPSN